jgi:hypothetical protein
MINPGGWEAGGLGLYLGRRIDVPGAWEKGKKGKKKDTVPGTAAFDVSVSWCRTVERDVRTKTLAF